MHTPALDAPLRFTPVYQELVWGGRRIAGLRPGVPAGPIGEAWDIADHPRGMSVVRDGPWAGTTLGDLTRQHGRALVGRTWDGGEFPLLVKLIDAADRLSVQVHPDDTLAQALGKAPRGKTECWRLLADGGNLYVGTTPGTDRPSFAEGLAAGRIADHLQQHAVRAGDFFFIPARTVHALGAGCLLIEVQQTCDVTFRVHDWGRVGLDGKPRPLHLDESLATIDFAAHRPQPEPTVTTAHPDGGDVRHLITCPYFEVSERRGPTIRGGGDDRCTLVSSLAGTGRIHTAGGSVEITPTETVLIPAAAGAWWSEGDLHLLISQPG